jgi:hypothetical protein
MRKDARCRKELCSRTLPPVYPAPELSTQKIYHEAHEEKKSTKKDGLRGKQSTGNVT